MCKQCWRADRREAEGKSAQWQRPPFRIEFGYVDLTGFLRGMQPHYLMTGDGLAVRTGAPTVTRPLMLRGRGA